MQTVERKTLGPHNSDLESSWSAAMKLNEFLWKGFFPDFCQTTYTRVHVQEAHLPFAQDSVH